MQKMLTPRLAIGLGIFIAAFILQWSAMSYLTGISKNQFKAESKKYKTQIAQDLSNQLSRAMTAEDDLAALSVLKESRTTHPQLQKCAVFEKTGKIILHSNPNMLSQATKPYKGPRPVSPEVSRTKQDGRLYTIVLVPMVHDDELYFRAFFDETGLVQNSNAFSVRFYILIIAASLLIALFALLRLRRYDLTDPRRRAEIQPTSQSAKSGSARHTAELLLSEMRHAVLAIDRNNKIIAANSLALELLNCRVEELTGMHVMQSPLPRPMMNFYQTAIKQPGHPQEERLVLGGKGPALPVKIVFTPASENWEIALISLA